MFFHYILFFAISFMLFKYLLKCHFFQEIFLITLSEMESFAQLPSAFFFHTIYIFS
jgi:hypothetical protein